MSSQTGTITTAKMTMNLDKTVVHADTLKVLREAGILAAASGPSADKDAVILLAALGSNPAKVEDAIDSAVMRAYNGASMSNAAMKRQYDSFTKLELTGFNPEFKRTVATLSLANGRKVYIAKGLLTKVLDTSAGGVDTAPMQWVCAGIKENPEFGHHLMETDESLADEGYKTIAVAARVDEGPMLFLGILPMIDPPREDSKKTIDRLRDAGVETKMITGDHQNIAKETARMVGISTNIRKGEEMRDATITTQELIRHAGGFAQVLPRDKRECVLVLQKAYGLVVGMTGDGVNDAPALSAAQCGIAVADATDAAKVIKQLFYSNLGQGKRFRFFAYCLRRTRRR
jgi:H+-transporting ATPase